LWEQFGQARFDHQSVPRPVNIPFYEECGRIHWWQYSACRMISFTPWYIILGEFGTALRFGITCANTAARFCHCGVGGLIGESRFCFYAQRF